MMWSPRWPAAAGRWSVRACRRIRPAGTLTSDFRPPNCERRNVCCFRSPAVALGGGSHRKLTLPQGGGGRAGREGGWLPRACKIHDRGDVSIQREREPGCKRSRGHLFTRYLPVLGVMEPQGTGWVRASRGVPARCGHRGSCRPTSLLTQDQRPQTQPGNPWGCLVRSLFWESPSPPCPDLGL